jgi:hypothetical protein
MDHLRRNFFSTNRSYCGIFDETSSMSNVWFLVLGSIAHTKSVIYDNNCSCALNENCTTQATYINTTSFQIISIKDLKMGCTSSESFFLRPSNVSMIHLVSIFFNNRLTTYVPVPLFINSNWICTHYWNGDHWDW